MLINVTIKYSMIMDKIRNELFRDTHGYINLTTLLRILRKNLAMGKPLKMIEGMIATDSF